MKTPREYAEEALKDWPKDAPHLAVLKEAILNVAERAVKAVMEDHDIREDC